MQVLRDVVAAVAGADDERALARPCGSVVVLARMQHLAAESAQRRDLRQVGNAAHAGRHHQMPRMHFALLALRRAHDGRPPFGGYVVRAAFELAARPVVELHRLDVGLEPVGELVLGDVDGPVRRERHVGQVIHVHLVMQGERVVAPPPVVADARPAIDDEGIDAELAKPGGDRQTRLAATDDEHVRVAAAVVARGLAQVGPGRSAEVAGVAVTARPAAAGALFVAL